MMKMFTLMKHFILSLTSLAFDLLASVMQESPGLREQLIKRGDIKIQIHAHTGRKSGAWLHDTELPTLAVHNLQKC